MLSDAVLKPGHPEVTDSQVATLVDKKILRLQISMDDSGRMDILQPAQDLVQEKHAVREAERLAGADHSVEISVHDLVWRAQ